MVPELSTIGSWHPGKAHMLPDSANSCFIVFSVGTAIMFILVAVMTRQRHVLIARLGGVTISTTL